MRVSQLYCLKRSQVPFNLFVIVVYVAGTTLCTLRGTAMKNLKVLKKSLNNYNTTNVMAQNKRKGKCKITDHKKTFLKGMKTDH